MPHWPSLRLFSYWSHSGNTDCDEGGKTQIRSPIYVNSAATENDLALA
jgi:hypothetical protein